MGYVDYFLIVWDFIKYAKDHGIAVRPRAWGLQRKYCFPTAWELRRSTRSDISFVRAFLNPERVSMPDIDVDFCYERRQEVIDYVGKIRKRQSGSDRDIRNAGGKRCDSRCGARDGYAVCFVDSIAKMIPQSRR